MVSFRDVFKNESYFNDLIEFYSSGQALYFDKASTTSDINHKASLLRTMVIESIEKWIALYSKGAEKEELLNNFYACLKNIEIYSGSLDENKKVFDFNNFDEYILSLWLVSISRLLSVNKDDHSKLINLIDNAHEDGFFDELTGFYDKDTISEVLLYPDIVENLFNLSSYDKNERAMRVSKYLNDYYSNMKKCYWYNRHLEDDTGYFGYWSFEVAAVVMINDIDDSSFIDNIYYPRDLTGRRLYKTWEDSPEGEAAREAIKERQQD